MNYSCFKIIFLFIFSLGLAQNETEEHFYFHVNIAGADQLKIKKKRDGTFEIKNRRNKRETQILNTYNIYDFRLAYPNTDRALLKTVHVIATDKVELLGALKHNFPKKYTRVAQFYTTKNAYYPNDYGTTSPVKNLGNPHPAYDLDIIMAPEAWGITTGNKKVVVGISDSKVDSLNPDLIGRVSEYIKYNDKLKGMACVHGTNIAGTAVGTMNNGYGRPGICSGCDIVANDYGSFTDIEELVAAGAKVINCSWAMCRMGSVKYRENIQERINEYYDDGIIIVAAAGNGTDCNKDKIKVGDSLYPASFDNVISTAGVYLKNSFYEDDTWINPENNRKMTRLQNDRHASHFYIEDNGSITPHDIQKVHQVNAAVDILAPTEGYLLGNDNCNQEDTYGGASSNTAPYVTGTIGLMWSENYCLSSYEIESILKLTSEDVENLSGNEPYKGMLGAGRLNTYRAVLMSSQMKDPLTNVTVKNRDFYRFDFTLSSAPNKIIIKNQTFRENATVDFKSKNGIILKPGTHLKPNKKGFIKLVSDPSIIVDTCEKKTPKKYVPYREMELEKSR
ncbi:MAG: hypothetical protein ACJAX3_001288 [Patiriisocius sp.]|jgi:hypothetical protein